MERFWTFLTTLDSDKFAKFMKDNLAGTVLFFSLVIWIPASCYISHQVSFHYIVAYRKGIDGILGLPSKLLSYN